MNSLLERLTAALADRYALDREIGEGGMATVFLATDIRHERPVAIKVLHPELSAMLGPDRFLSEIKLTASLQHPHILPLFDSGVADGLLYYVMPFVEGETLRRRLDREQQLPVADAVRLATEIADALEYAHVRGIVHRDVKPENVLLQSGRAVVADFGIALAVQHAGGTRMTQTGLSLGTPQYMAPEQAMGERNVDARADIYALGAMTYEMLAGEPPFTGPTAQAIVARVMTERARRLRVVRDTVPESVEAAVATALEKLPADRFASAAEFSQALALPVSSAGLYAGPGSRPSPVRRVAPIAALAALLGVVAGAATAWSVRSPQAEVPSLPLHVEVTPPDSLALRVICCGQMFAISPDGRWLLFQGSPMSDSTTGGAMREVFLYLRDLTDLRTRLLPGTANATSMFFSPNSEEIGFVSNRQLWRLPLTASDPQLIASVPEGFVGGGSWSDDDHITLAVSGKMLQVSTNGGTLVPLFPEDTTGRQFGGPQHWSREQVLLYTVSSFVQPPQVYWRSLKTGQTRMVMEGATPVYVPAERALLLVRADGALLKYPFDLAAGDTTGPGVVVANRIDRRSPVLLHGEYAVSATGTLVTVKRRGATTTKGLTFVNLRAGAPPTPPLAPIFSLFYFLDFAATGDRLLVTGMDASGGAVPYVFDVQRGALTRVAIDGRLSAIGWASGGDSILYSANRGELWVRAIDGSGSARKALDLQGWSFSGRMSAWGSWVAFSSQQGTETRRVGVVHRDSASKVRMIGSMNVGESDPTISPDGKWLAFTSNQNGRDDVFVTSFPEPGGRFVVSLGGGSDATWARDARTLYFQQGNQIMAASFLPGQPPTIGAPRAIYQRDPWGLAAVAPDGQLFAFADVAREGDPVALVVQLQALRER